jgi:hypothetical protein
VKSIAKGVNRLNNDELVVHLALAYLQKQDTAGLSPEEFIEKYREIYQEISHAFYGEPGATIIEAE